MDKELTSFEVLAKVNVNEHTETKEGLTYLSWAWAWDAVKRKYPDAEYMIWRDADGRPYLYDPVLGYMVFTKVTLDYTTYEMWLPVMDSKNKAMKAEPYTYFDKYNKEKTVQAATMFDINKTIMRCLVKNLAMFGLGLYIYAGEDLPTGETESTPQVETKPKAKKAEPKKPEPELSEVELRTKVVGYCSRHFNAEQVDKLCKHYKVSDVYSLSGAQCADYIAQITKAGGNIDE